MSRSWAAPGRSWPAPRASWASLGASGAALGSESSIFTQTLKNTVKMQSDLASGAPSWTQVGPKLALSWPQLAQVGLKLAQRRSKVFQSRPKAPQSLLKVDQQSINSWRELGPTSGHSTQRRSKVDKKMTRLLSEVSAELAHSRCKVDPKSAQHPLVSSHS